MVTVKRCAGGKTCTWMLPALGVPLPDVACTWQQRPSATPAHNHIDRRQGIHLGCHGAPTHMHTPQAEDACARTTAPP